MADLGRRGSLAILRTLSLVLAVATAPIGAQAVSSALYSGLTWRCIGPFDGGPVSSVSGIAGVPGVYTLTTPAGDAWMTRDGGDTWTPFAHQDAPAVSGDPRRWVDPSNPRRIARVDARGISMSVDAGQTWLAALHLPIADVARLEPHVQPIEPPARRRTINGTPATVSIADPVRAGLIFAATGAAIHVSFDNGVRWESLQLNLPNAVITDLDIRGNDLVAATTGWSSWQLTDISPLRQLSTAMASAPEVLFKPAVVTLKAPGSAELAAPVGNIDYYVHGSPTGPITIDVIDTAGRIVHHATSAPADAGDSWLPVMRPLPSTPGHHRVVWDLRWDAPPSLNHRFAQMARTIFEDMPPDPAGPRVLAGTYRLRLSIDGRTDIQPLVIQDRSSAAAQLAARRQFDLAMKLYDLMQVAHREFVRLARVRAELKPLIATAIAGSVTPASDLDARVAAIDGSDWTGLVIPDAEDEAAGEVDEKEGKHPDFKPPAPVSVSKDYDDPTSILGRRFANVDRPPAFATISSALGEMLTRTIKSETAPDAAALVNYDKSCQQLSAVLDTWRALNQNDLPRLNADLIKQKVSPLPLATSVSAITCGPVR